ncbi:hypothetical protein L3Q82_002883 [Scortum barcoo]|uniref:Uncharacterized protein n=1 Tax=Scortum barcoo TaxID=214431 RepID=A0ACB8VVA4_9TELE|nr:hypothetical protein L3Q82_002883 [Scortum barcoo]
MLWTGPPCSPDLNPIEHIWDIMSRSIHQRHIAPQTVEELADALVQTLTRMFDHTSLAREASRALLRVKQGDRQVVDYAIEFQTLEAERGWNGPALNEAFVNGLSENLKSQLAPHELPPGFEDLVDFASRIDRTPSLTLCPGCSNRNQLPSNQR